MSSVGQRATSPKLTPDSCGYEVCCEVDDVQAFERERSGLIRGRHLVKEECPQRVHRPLSLS